MVFTSDRIFSFESTVVRVAGDASFGVGGGMWVRVWMQSELKRG
jgi:hypothetical protein